MKTIRLIAGLAALLCVSGCADEAESPQTDSITPPVTPLPPPPRYINPRPGESYNYPSIDDTANSSEGTQDSSSEDAKALAAVQQHWLDYLKTIQDENDYANWSRPPYTYIMENLSSPRSQ
jgi:hypothetical protein